MTRSSSVSAFSEHVADNPDSCNRRTTTYGCSIGRSQSMTSSRAAGNSLRAAMQSLAMTVTKLLEPVSDDFGHTCCRNG